ncbi:MAG: hypothetical protein ABIV63_19790 [Caldimonas sp.]
MQRETYERAGAQARSLSVLRKDNPFVRPSSNAEEQQRLQTLAEHWWRGWDTWTSYIRPRGRALDPNRR